MKIRTFKIWIVGFQRLWINCIPMEILLSLCGMQLVLSMNWKWNKMRCRNLVLCNLETALMISCLIDLQGCVNELKLDFLKYLTFLFKILDAWATFVASEFCLGPFFDNFFTKYVSYWKVFYPPFHSFLPLDL